ncbi:MAG TPA: 50S ribosomal protein L25/general stress protein Ctc [Thiobacillaceae bacterium]|nr:50S ribosomal protein L25/general stress protein Ctc [Thiobacillaceae bacterium]
MQIEVNAKKRDVQGSGASRRLRRAGLVPGVLYGGDKPAESIVLDHKDLFLQVRHEAFHSSILSMKLDGEDQMALLRDLQWHPFKQQILHADFQRVDKGHKIHIKVPLHFINQDTAPGVKLGHGLVSHVITELDVECLPGNLPEFIEVNLGEMQLGQSIHVNDLKLGEGVEPVAHLKAENPVVAVITPPKVGAEETPAAEAAAPAGEPPAA